MTDENLWDYVERSGERDDCWNWTGTFNNFNSPTYYSPSRQKVLSAARVVYVTATGRDLPPGVIAERTKCTNRRCVNPDHRTPMTRAAASRVRRNAPEYIQEAVKLFEPDTATTASREIDGRTYTVTTYPDDFAQAKEASAAQEREMKYWDIKREYMHFRDPNMTLHKMVREGRLGRTHRFDKTEDLDNQHQP